MSGISHCLSKKGAPKKHDMTTTKSAPMPINKHITESPVLKSMGWPQAKQTSISGRLKNASFAEKEGLIDAYQKGLIKDLIISGDERLGSALDAYDKGNKKQLKDLLQSGFLAKRSERKIELFESDDLDIGFLNVSQPRSTIPKDGMFALEEVSFSSNHPNNGSVAFPDPATPGPVQNNSFMNLSMPMSINPGNLNYGDLSNYSPALNAYGGGGGSIAGMIHSSPGMVPYRSPGMHPMGHHSAYQSPNIHGMSPSGFGFPDDFTNFNFEGNSRHLSDRMVNGGGLSSSRMSMMMGTPSPMIQPMIPKVRVTKAQTKKKKSSAPRSQHITIPKQKKSEAKGSFVGPYSPRSRRKRIERYLKKRKQRVWTKRVKYDVRKNFADSRLRVKGRFVKKEDEELLRELMNMA